MQGKVGPERRIGDSPQPERGMRVYLPQTFRTFRTEGACIHGFRHCNACNYMLTIFTVLAYHKFVGGYTENRTALFVSRLKNGNDDVRPCIKTFKYSTHLIQHGLRQQPK